MITALRKPFQMIARIPDYTIIKGSKIRRAAPFLKKMRENEDTYQSILLGMIVLRHVVGTIIYTTASWFNTGMPKEQRRFAASIDLMNGFYNFFGIVGLGILINKHSGKWANKVLKTLEHNPMRHELAKLGFRSVLTVGVSGVIAQRVITPFIATPSAKWFKEKYLMKHEDNPFILYPDPKKHPLYKTDPVSSNNFASSQAFDVFQKRSSKKAVE